ncbi:toll/interleukin-1 receptor domain-containing protein [Hoeflea sp. EC-HK425]|uniref:toll/interleukin-1 receptor domain-containing protein n=1 Tax=Hoeflea sp. EC-HK425 TaxID=2038388 RepID=UPI0012510E3D|nr:toll/interleukin-1 receptor domain-containing protein [Hoeflea sp. EC-HK425]VVT02532.1 hypothetical protein HOE425_310156 [Hoeflea sp. EC-HK425]
MKYWGFISYSHADNHAKNRNWASWIHKEIERYEIPTDLVGSKNKYDEIIPKKIYPIFLDNSELSTDISLDQSIRSALDASRNMIVLCSPHATKSRHVVAEIDYFISLDRKERIVPVVLAGHPERQTCFPSPLLDGPNDEPLAADFRTTDGSQGFTSLAAYRESLAQDKAVPASEITRAAEEYEQRSEQAKLRIISAILGVSFEQLAQRDRNYRIQVERRKARVLRRWVSLVSVLGIVAIAAAGIANDRRIEANHARSDAEDLVEFLQNDAHSELSKLGRLDIMELLNRRVFKYLDNNDATLSGFQQRVKATAEYQLGMDALALGKAEVAQEHLRLAISASQHAAELDQRVDWLDIAAIANWRSASIDYQYGRLDSAITKLNAASKYADRVLALDPDNTRALEAWYGHAYEFAAIKSDQGDQEAALVDLRELIAWFENRRMENDRATEPDHVNLYVKVSRVSDIAGLRQEAFEAAVSAVQLAAQLGVGDAADAVKAEANMQLARMHELSNNTSAASKQLNRAFSTVTLRLKRAPDSMQALIQAIEVKRLLATIQQKDGAIRQALQTLAQRSEYARRLHQLDSLAPYGILILVECLTFEASLLDAENQMEEATRLRREAYAMLQYAINADISDPAEVSWQAKIDALTKLLEGSSNGF